jgi:exodeoxyribonuclease VII large subunit
VNGDLFFQAANARALGSDGVPNVWSVAQVNSLTRQLLEGAIPPLWVAGEVSGFKRYPSGHCYFALKDERSQLACVMWRDEAQALPTEPPEGMAVHVFGYVSLFERQGRYQFVVRELNARGEGLWRLAFERLRRRLESEGLLDPGRKRPLPRFPVCVGVITSTEGAALRDIVSVVRRRAPWTHILVYPSRVQGDDAARTIVSAIAAACNGGHADVLVVGRGGGSLEDLRAFNDERVARAIAGSTIPIVSAVGHESDLTLADLVADRRAATPSAAAELVVPDRLGLSGELARARQRLAGALQNGITQRARRIERMEERMVEAVGRRIDRDQARVGALRQRLQALGPMAVMQRGYSLALDDRGRILRSVGDFRAAMDFELRLADGRVGARVRQTSRRG